MTDSSINILVGGEAGQGLVTIGQLMAKALVRSGYEILVVQDYMSRIRGGHNTFVIRTGPEKIHGPKSGVDVLVALNQETIDLHRDELTDRAVIIAHQDYDCHGHEALKVPFEKLASKPVYENVVALGVLASAICHDKAVIEDLLAKTFAKKGQTVVDENLKVFNDSYEWVGSQNFGVECMPPASAAGQKRLMVQGNECIALGAMAAGCNFCSFYPMTPSTSVALALIDKGREMGVVTEQAEDEIAAINMAIGASFAGARALVPTSGGGFALMTEGISLAGMTETPVVVVVVQRPGPATGLPTRTEQADLNLVVYAGHGEFPRAVYAPGTMEECFYLAYHSFNLAEKYQSPVFILSDQYLADSFRAVEPFDLEEAGRQDRPITEADAGYERYSLAADGVSPRLVPGFSDGLVVVDSDEHTPDGHITEDMSVRVRMQAKRLSKAAGFVQEVVPPTYEGSDDPDILFVCWGSSYGPVKEAVDILNHKNRNAALLHFCQVYPLNGNQFLPSLMWAERVIFVESNSTGQFARLIKQETGFEPKDMVLRFDGLPLSAAYILNALPGL